MMASAKRPNTLRPALSPVVFVLHGIEFACGDQFDVRYSQRKAFTRDGDVGSRGMVKT
jgi:hypothetical protein